MTKSKKLLIIALIILILLILIRLSLPALGNYLVADDELDSIAMPNQTNIIVLLMGSGPDRMLQAVDIYKEGYVSEIIMVQNLERGYDIATDLGVDIPRDTEIKKEVAVQLGVAPGDVRIIPGDALSTQDEAISVREYLKNKDKIDTLIVVTSKYHSTRSKKIFAKAMKSFDADIKVLSSPTDYDDFKPDIWWKDREDLKRGLSEYAKLVNFYLREQFVL
jgi:uncharacterized SAM-binding protein YcdF (DUF218 family)